MRFERIDKRTEIGVWRGCAIALIQGFGYGYYVTVAGHRLGNVGRTLMQARRAARRHVRQHATRIGAAVLH